MKKRTFLRKAQKEALYLRAKYSCEVCKLEEWLGKKAVLEVHHLDQDSSNNDLENLQLLCLQCHAQTPNWRGRSKKLIGPKQSSKDRSKDPCPLCCNLKYYKSKHCLECSGKLRQKFNLPIQELELLLDTIPLTKIGELFGVSDNAIKKRAIKLGLEWENRRGYWS